MGLFDSLKDTLAGASSEESNANKQKMRSIFNSLVPDGDAYKLVYMYGLSTTNAVVVRINTYANYIVGYKDDGSMVVIAVDDELEEYDESVFLQPSDIISIKRKITNGQYVWKSDKFKGGSAMMSITDRPLPGGQLMIKVFQKEEAADFIAMVQRVYNVKL